MFSRCVPLIVLIWMFGVVGMVPQVSAVTTLEVNVAGGDGGQSKDSISLLGEDGKKIEKSSHAGQVLKYKELNPGNYRVLSGEKVVRNIHIGGADTIKRITVNPLLANEAGTDVPNMFNNNTEGPTITFPFNYRLGIRGFGTYTSRDVDLYTNFTSPIMSDFSGFNGGVGVDADIPIPGTPLFFRGSFGWMPDAEESGRREDIHPPANQLDTLVEFRQTYNFRASLGYTFLRWNKLEADVLVGGEAAHTEITTITDETGGGGRLNVFTESAYRFSPTLSFNLRQNIDIPNDDDHDLYVYGGWTGSYQSGIAVQGISNLNFNYNSRIDTGWNHEFYLGLGVQF